MAKKEALKSFTKVCEDNSWDERFQFTFHCDRCGNAYESSRITSQTSKTEDKLRRRGDLAYKASSMLGAYKLGNLLERGADLAADRFDDRSEEWEKEHAMAFQVAQDEAKNYFNQCTACGQWVCPTCWISHKNMCVGCVAGGATVVDSEKCPACGMPGGGGRFCNHCGASLEGPKCPSCGAEVVPGVRFCGECGKDLGAVGAAAKPTFCPDCGGELKPGAKFCGQCGKAF